MRLIVSAICACLLAACSISQPASSVAPSAERAVPSPLPTAAPDRAEVGRAAYVATCARCHDEGVGGAPVTGQPQDWQNRSRLWEAVLFEHAEAGYLSMPPRGGDAALTERETRAAAEYMLNITNPHLPAD